MAGVLFICATADGLTRERFDDWYDRVHLPGGMQVPGFRCAVRLREIGEETVRATGCLYVLSSTAVLDSRAYLNLQAETSADTASHVADVHLNRLAGDVVEGNLPSSTQWSQANRLLLAAVTPKGSTAAATGTSAARVRLSSGAGPSRRYEGYDLSLRLVGSAADKSGAPPDAFVSWILEPTRIVHTAH